MNVFSAREQLHTLSEQKYAMKLDIENSNNYGLQSILTAKSIKTERISIKVLRPHLLSIQIRNCGKGIYNNYE